MTRFERDVFLSVLQQMATDKDFPYGYTSIGQSIKELFVFNCYILNYEFEYITDPIDCTSDPCHMAWLIRDNPSLMRHVYYANCSNGTRFEDLDRNGYNNCPPT